MTEFVVGRVYASQDINWRCTGMESDMTHCGVRQPIKCVNVDDEDQYRYYTSDGIFDTQDPGGSADINPAAWIVESPTLPDSGDRTEFDTGAVRDAMSGKGLPSLIPPEALRRLARRFEDGATKYGRDNWQKGIPLSRYHDAILRHTLSAAEGKTDEDHLGAVLWNAAAWVWTEDAISSGQLPAELDDRAYTEIGNADHS